MKTMMEQMAMFKNGQSMDMDMEVIALKQLELLEETTLVSQVYVVITKILTF